MTVEIYKDGPLLGQASVNILLDAETDRYLQHASSETGYSLDRLVEISASEAALRYALDNNLKGVS